MWLYAARVEKAAIQEALTRCIPVADIVGWWSMKYVKFDFRTLFLDKSPPLKVATAEQETAFTKYESEEDLRVSALPALRVLRRVIIDTCPSVVLGVLIHLSVIDDAFIQSLLPRVKEKFVTEKVTVAGKRTTLSIHTLRQLDRVFHDLPKSVLHNFTQYKVNHPHGSWGEYIGGPIYTRWLSRLRDHSAALDACYEAEDSRVPADVAFYPRENETLKKTCCCGNGWCRKDVSDGDRHKVPTDAGIWIEIVQHEPDIRVPILAALAKENSCLHLHRDHFYPSDLCVNQTTGRTTLKDAFSFKVKPRFRSKSEIANNTHDKKRALSSEDEEDLSHTTGFTPPRTKRRGTLPLSPTSNEANLKDICREGFCADRRLTLAEVEAILRDPAKYFSAPSSYRTASSPPPQRGDVILYVYDVTKTQLYTRDGLPWVRASEEQVLLDGAVETYVDTCKLSDSFHRYRYFLSSVKPAAGGIASDETETLTENAMDQEDQEDHATSSAEACDEEDDGGSDGDYEQQVNSDDDEEEESKDDVWQLSKGAVLVLVHYFDETHEHYGGPPGATVAGSWLLDPPSADKLKQALQGGYAFSIKGALSTYTPPLGMVRDLAYSDGTPISDEDYEAAMAVSDMRNPKISAIALESLRNIFRRADWSAAQLSGEGIGPQMIGDLWLQPRDNPALFFVLRLALLRMDKTLKERGGGSGAGARGEDRTAFGMERRSDVGEDDETSKKYRNLEMQHLAGGKKCSYRQFFHRCVQLNGYNINAALVLSRSEKTFFKLIVDKIKRLLSKVAGLLHEGGEGPPKVTRQRNHAARSARYEAGAEAGLVNAKSSSKPSQPLLDRQALMAELEASTKRGEELARNIEILTSSAYEFECSVYELNVVNLRLCKHVAQLGLVHCRYFGKIATNRLRSMTYDVLREHRAAVDGVLKTAKEGGYQSVFVLCLPESTNEACGQRQAHRESLDIIAEYKVQLNTEIARLESQNNSLRGMYNTKQQRAREDDDEQRAREQEHREQANSSARPTATAMAIALEALDLTTLIQMVDEAKVRNLNLDERYRALCGIAEADEVQVANVKTVERDVQIALWHKVAAISLHHYDLQRIEQRIDAVAEKRRDNTKLRLEAYECRKALHREVCVQVKVAQRKMQDSQLVTDVAETSQKAIDRRNTFKKNISLLQKYAECLEGDIAASESDDEDVKELLKKALDEIEERLGPFQRLKQRLLAHPRLRRPGRRRRPVLQRTKEEQEEFDRLLQEFKRIEDRLVEAEPRRRKRRKEAAIARLQVEVPTTLERGAALSKAARDVFLSWYNDSDSEPYR